MALPEINAICTTCRTPFRGRPTRSFLGFQKLTCPAGHRVLYPLTRGYRIAYWVLIALIGVRIVAIAASGHIAVPGILGILIIIGLVSDRKIRKQVAALTPAQSKTGGPQPRPQQPLRSDRPGSPTGLSNRGGENQRRSALPG